MARVTGQDRRCLSEHGVMRLFSGALDSAERGVMDGHLAHCDRCARLVGEAARDTGAGSAGLGDRLRPPVLSPGMLIANRYHVRRLLGVGAMGEVHEVEDSLLGTVVALKTLNARLAGDTSALARLKREVAAARSVTHPNVCRTFDLGSDHGSNSAPGAFVFLTMEYLPGVTLTKFLTAHGPYAPRAALPLLIQLADGLAAAHVAGILHRDLKAENVMLVDQKSGGVRGVIMDFGLAGFDMQDEVGVEHGSGFSGTVAYAAPERIAGGRATPASDVYSLGLIAHEMLTNQRPIPGVSGARLADGRPLPASWERLIRRAIHLDPKVRFANGAALGEALRELAGGTKRGAAWGRRSVALAAVASTAVIAAVVSWTSRWRDERPLLTTEAHAVTMPRALPEPEPARPAILLDRATAPVFVDQVVVPVVDSAAFARPKRSSGKRPPSAPVRALTAMASSRTDAPPASESPPRTPDDDLVREVRFVPAAPVAASGGVASDADLVDPFARRRSQRGPDPAP
jgi:serine/threonine protein kinase